MSDSIIDLLRAQLPERCVLHQEEDLRPYECDALSAYRQLPLAVVIPETLEQVRTTLTLCNAHRVPVVARGAGTGLSGGAMPLGDGILLSMVRFNRILDIDTANRCARVQPGVTNLSISKAAEPWGLYYAPDPSSQIACSIGGNVAENAGGVHCLKYGLTVHNLLEITFATIDGELVTVGGGGLVAGIAGYLESVDPRIEIIGCQPENSRVMYESVRAGEVLDLESLPTLADGTAGGVDADSVTFGICRDLIDAWELLSEDEIAGAILLALDKQHILIEGAAAMPIAALVRNPERFAGQTVVLVLSGAKLGISTLRELLARSSA